MFISVFNCLRSFSQLVLIRLADSYCDNVRLRVVVFKWVKTGVNLAAQ